MNEQTHGWLGILAGAAKKTLKPDSVVTAAAIAYFAIFSIFPLTLLSIAIASYSLGSLMDQHVIVQKLEFIAPALGQLLGKNIDEIIRVRGPVTIVAFLSLIWSASTIFYMLTGTLNEIWGKEQSRPVWKRRGLAILIVLVFVGPILFLVSFADNMLTNLLHLVARPSHSDHAGYQFGTGCLARYCLVLGSLQCAPAWRFHLARDYCLGRLGPVSSGS